MASSRSCSGRVRVRTVHLGLIFTSCVDPRAARRTLHLGGTICDIMWEVKYFAILHVAVLMHLRIWRRCSTSPLATRVCLARLVGSVRSSMCPSAHSQEKSFVWICGQRVLAAFIMVRRSCLGGWTFILDTAISSRYPARLLYRSALAWFCNTANRKASRASGSTSTTRVKHDWDSVGGSPSACDSVVCYCTRVPMQCC